MAYNHFSYFAKIAEKMPEIGSAKYLKASTPGQIEGLIAQNSCLTDFILVACSKAESKLLDSGNEAFFQNNKFEFMVLHPSTQDNSDSIFETFENCENLCNRIISRLAYDSRNGEGIPLLSLQPELTQFDMVGPIANVWYGVLVAFTLKEPYKYTFNPQEWNE